MSSNVLPLQRTPRALERCYSVADVRRLAWRRLPAPIFHYLDGGADDERTLERNTAAFDDYAFLPQTMRDITRIDLGVTLLGRRIALPFILSPTGMSRLFHHEAELAVARAAAESGTFYSLSTLATTSLEDIAAAGQGPRIFQVYILKDRELTRELAQRCRAARYDALCLTIDTPVAGNRERDRVTGMTMPPRFTAKSFASFASRPRWASGLLLHPQFELNNIAHRAAGVSGSLVSVIDYVNAQFDRSITWRDVEWLAALWNGPFIVKGVQSVVDAQRAVAAGATALMISNHGGRQLDGAMAPVDLVAAIRAAVGSSIELIVDGGVRRGSHVLKALALGANACSIGRPYLYGLAAGGRRGVEHVLALLRAEIERDMILLGCATLAELDCNYLKRMSS